MNDSNEKVTSYLTGHKNTYASTVEDLQRLADEHPYFPVTQFLLAKKLKAQSESSYLQQVQKTALYFSNPYWLHYQLSKDNFTEEEDEVNVTSAIANTQETFENDTPANNEAPVITTHFSADKLIAASNLAHQTLQESPEAEHSITTTADLEDVKDTNFPAATETEIAENGEEMAGVTHETDKTTEQFLEEIQPASANNILPQVVTSENAHASYIGKEHNNHKKAEPDEHEQMFRNIKAMLDASGEEADADTENTAIPIDPYYTVDYFASQGIKLEFDPNPKDQLGQHLKKFTQWLKHMKKLGPEDATESINRTETEADIQKIADASNTAREVVTEAMASVLEKQGRNDKAIELYNKLSFLNPRKSAYFAAKIKTLKGI